MKMESTEGCELLSNLYLRHIENNILVGAWVYGKL